MNRALKIGLIVVSFIALISSLSYFIAPYDTETAHIITVKNALEANGYILRKETLIKNNSGGVFEAYVKDGARVAKGSSLGIFTEGALDNELITKLQDVTSRINAIKDASSFAEVYSSDEARIYSAMHELSADIRKNIVKKDFAEATDNTENLAALISKKHSVENADASDKLLVSLEEEKYNLEKQLGGIRKDVSAPESGYFYSHLDGLEGLWDDKSVSELTTTKITDFEAKLLENDQTGYSGKIADSYIWYFVTVLPSSDVEKLSPGQSVTLSSDGSAFVNATIFALNPDEAGNTAVILKCDRSIPGIYEKRTVQVEICISEYTGFYVPSAAIRVKDNVTGVYVMNKFRADEFKCVKIIYEEDDYYIVRKNYAHPEDCPFPPLSHYDNILVNPEVVGDDIESEK